MATASIVYRDSAAAKPRGHSGAPIRAAGSCSGSAIGHYETEDFARWSSMTTTGRALWAVCAAGWTLAALALTAVPAAAGDTGQRSPVLPRSVASMVTRGTVETVHFADRHQPAVKLVRGVGGQTPHPVSREIVSFGDGTARRVTIVRGTVDPTASPASAPSRQAALVPQSRVERVAFADPGLRSVTVVRGGAALREAFAIDLFGSADPGELDRIAVAVHGVESSHGTNPAMWRSNLAGPQGPMQVSAAAALDVGGGNRFDIDDNRRLGRAYLDKMFRRYGNWSDALAAYNWGPGNVDLWIARGRDPERMPLETVRYLEIVLRNALMTKIAVRR
jgi:hypothetical protein